LLRIRTVPCRWQPHLRHQIPASGADDHEDGMDDSKPRSARESANAVRRAQVVEALADAAGTVARPGPVRVALDALTGGGARSLADDLAAALSARGRRCRRHSVDAFDHLDGRGPAPSPDPAGPSRAPGMDLLVVDGSFLQHAEFLGAWALVIFVRDDAAIPALAAPPGSGRDGAVARYLA
jgi:hypothetical protein